MFCAPRECPQSSLFSQINTFQGKFSSQNSFECDNKGKLWEKWLCNFHLKIFGRSPSSHTQTHWGVSVQCSRCLIRMVNVDEPLWIDISVRKVFWWRWRRPIWVGWVPFAGGWVLTIVVAKHQLTAKSFTLQYFNCTALLLHNTLHLHCTSYFALQHNRLSMLHCCTLHFWLQCNLALQCKISPMHIAKPRLCWWDFSPCCTALWCYLTLGDGIQPAYSTRNFNANILHQNQHNPRQVIKMVLGL